MFEHQQAGYLYSLTHKRYGRFNPKERKAMACCPVCKRYDIFGEQISYLNVVSDYHYFDCPQCGAFRMDERTQHIAANLDTPDAETLLEWIRERNTKGWVPLVKEYFILSISRRTGSRVLVQG